jgi:alpha-L-fucosidase 2
MVDPVTSLPSVPHDSRIRTIPSHPTRFVSCLLILLLTTTALYAQSATDSTAWSDGTFHMERRGLVERSDVILHSPNEKPQQAMPLGNGRLGLGVWAQDGYTAQLNRADTFPHRLSPGQVTIPGLTKLTQAKDYSGRLNIYDGEFEEHGAGIAAVTYVAAAQDVMIVDVTGTDPASIQTAELKLWSPRTPVASHSDQVGILAETWHDDKEAGASGEVFGSLSAITADALDLHVEKSGPLSVKVTFRPHPDGSFRILVAAPTWRDGDAASTAVDLLNSAKNLTSKEHRDWWNKYWEHVGLMKLASPNQSAEYLENIRMIDLYTAAAESGDRFPGSQAGIGDLFSSIRDEHNWGPSAFWHWNLRMQVSANLGAGVSELNKPYFALYRENLGHVIDWTKLHMGGREGICIPETMRFNGPGYENETWLPKPALNCAEDSKPYYNARTLSTGAEVSLWIWQQYLYTKDRQFLAENYPVMRESTRFLLAYASHDSHRRLHTFPSNAHETKWDVHDPTTDIAAMRVLFPAVIEAAGILKKDEEMVAKLKKELSLLPQFPLVDLATPKVLSTADDTSSNTILASSYDPEAETHNIENIGLEPVWPYGIIGDDGPMHSIAVRTFLNRPNKNDADWSADPVQAARLGLASEFKNSALALSEKYQTYPSGLASFMGPEFYVEQAGVIADALQSALVQDYDGLLRIAPAWPSDWSADGTVYIQHGGSASVQIRQGKVITVGIHAESSDVIRIRTPWAGHSLRILDAQTNSAVPAKHEGDIFIFSPLPGRTYLVVNASNSKKNLTFEAISGVPAQDPKSFGTRTIGIR